MLFISRRDIGSLRGDDHAERIRRSDRIQVPCRRLTSTRPLSLHGMLPPRRPAQLDAARRRGHDMRAPQHKAAVAFHVGAARRS